MPGHSPQLKPRPPVTLLTSPPGETRWGYYQFPDMWTGPSGEIYCAVNVGHDTSLGTHEDSRFFVTRDAGASWHELPYDELDLFPYTVTFPDGSQVAFGEERLIYHVHSYSPQNQSHHWHYVDRHHPAVASPPLRDAYDNHDWTIYRLGDLPPEERQFRRRWRAKTADQWQESNAVLEEKDLLLGLITTAYWWDDAGIRYSQEVPPATFRTVPKYGPEDLQLLPDGTLVWAQMCLHPQSVAMGKPYFQVVLLASADRGLTWHRRGTVAGDTHLTSDGYSAEEHSLALMADGSLLCVMRTVMGDRPGTTMYLAAARSTDGGFTWSIPEPIAPFSVTPHLVALPNGMAAVTYGRPGVYLRTSADSGRTWSEALPVVGPPEKELLADRWWDVRYGSYSGDKISCGNLGLVPAGPDRVLLAYSDFRPRTPEGEILKEVRVQEFVVG